jgi:hypothetical protein
MEVVERGILLQQLTDLESCPGIKILISSRPEDDIASLLDAKATQIRVDKRNSGSIQSYVNQRTRDWIRAANFDQEIRKKVETLLAPVTGNANGTYQQLSVASRHPGSIQVVALKLKFANSYMA